MFGRKQLRYFQIILFVLTVVISCSKDFNLRYSYLASYPLTILDKNGDTIQGRFVKSGDHYYMIHDSKDSNNQIESRGLFNGKLYYYRKFSVHEIRGYIDDGRKYEPVYITVMKREATYEPEKKQLPVFMQRLTPDSSYLQLYLHLVPDTGRGLLSQLLFHADTTIDHYDYYIQYYLHFPDEPQKVAWSLMYTVRENRRLREKLVESFSNCPALSETVTAMKALPAGGYVLRVLLLPDSTVKSRGFTALKERIHQFNYCYENWNGINKKTGAIP
ncbi:MAG TPA: hypothetical protein VHD35_02825 [Chitinophagaceae bacterium]|nr:hypothetical protein [Chitinophagaceae bacterium]